MRARGRFWFGVGPRGGEISLMVFFGSALRAVQGSRGGVISASVNQYSIGNGGGPLFSGLGGRSGAAPYVWTGLYTPSLRAHKKKVCRARIGEREAAWISSRVAAFRLVRLGGRVGRLRRLRCVVDQDY